MRAKAAAADVLRVCPPLFRSASKLYHTINTRCTKFQTLSPGIPQTLTKAFELAQRSVKGSVGDFYEFGMYRGSSFMSAFKTCQRLGLDDTRFYGFDSFSGLPQVEGIDRTDGRFFKGQFACSKQMVQRNLTQAGIDWSRVTLVEGYYEESLTEELRSHLPLRAAAVVLMDCDLYSSTATALNWMSGLLGVNSIILFDDWYSYGKMETLGQQKAFIEFLQKNPQFRPEPLWEFPHHGKTFILRETAGSDTISN